MTETPDPALPDNLEESQNGSEGAPKSAPGVEIGMTDGEGSTFEPEEDPEAHA